MVGIGQECGICSTLAKQPPAHHPSICCLLEKQEKGAQGGNILLWQRLWRHCSLLLTLTLFGSSSFAVSSLPRLVVVERGAVLAVGPCCVVLAHAFPMDLVGEREHGSPTAKRKELLRHEQCPGTGDTASARCYYIV